MLKIIISFFFYSALYHAYLLSVVSVLKMCIEDGWLMTADQIYLRVQIK